MKKNGYEWGLGEIMRELDITQNRLYMDTEIRTDTLRTLRTGDAKRIGVENMTSLLDALNQRAKEIGLDREYNVEDIIRKTPRG